MKHRLQDRLQISASDFLSNEMSTSHVPPQEPCLLAIVPDCARAATDQRCTAGLLMLIRIRGPRRVNRYRNGMSALRPLSPW